MLEIETLDLKGVWKNRRATTLTVDLTKAVETVPC